VQIETFALVYFITSAELREGFRGILFIVASQVEIIPRSIACWTSSELAVIRECPAGFVPVQLINCSWTVPFARAREEAKLRLILESADHSYLTGIDTFGADCRQL
jgi:hypothetical protein